MKNKITDNAKSVKPDRFPGVIAVVVVQEDHHPYKTLEKALVQSHFWNSLEKRQLALGKTAADLRIVIKPDLEIFDVESPTGTDPRLVEHLIALLYKKGYEKVSVVDGIGSADLWLENRDVEVLADLAGYRYVTDDGEPYTIVNLSRDLVDAGFEPGSLLEGSRIGKEWAEADFRICMAKNKTHQEFGYSLGLNSILSVLPLRDKEYHYYHRFDPGDVCMEVLKRTPVHFSVIDAVVSNHGSYGSFKANPLQTDTIIATEDIILGDFVGALKMGLDPYVCPVNALVMRNSGLPKHYKIAGSLDPYRNWQNVPVLLSDSVRRRNAYLPGHQMARAWFQSVNKEIFPFKNYIDERINKTLTGLLGEIDRHPLGLIGVTGLNYFVAWCNHLMQAYQVLYDKEKIARKQTALGIDLDKYSAGDYSGIIDYMEPLAMIVARTPPDHNGLRWRYMDKSVIFEYKRVLPLDYDKFVSRVDISAAVRMMNDNVGGSLVVVKRNNNGQVELQAERDIYLPQPNWMAVFGGDFIDVCKLELVKIEKRRQQIFWRTVASLNNTARFDDGVVTFAALPELGTEITIVARQEFLLPLFWQVFNVDYFPQVKDALVSDSYTTFFSRTMANYEAAYEGRSVETGKKWDERAGEEDSENPRMPIEQLVDTAMKVVEIAQPFIRAFRESRNRSRSAANQPGTQQGNTTDDNSPLKTFFDIMNNSAQSFFADLYRSVYKDMNTIGRKPDKENP